MASKKKKVTQGELRRLMNEQKKKLLNTTKKIESPLAKYDKQGTLTCIICEAVVKSEAVWSVHINSKNHKENIARKVKRKDKSPPPRPLTLPIAKSALKRPAPPVLSISKPVKSILKNAPPAPKYAKVPSNFFESENKSEPPTTAIATSTVVVEDEEDTELSVENDEELVNSDTLPQGFFDDPKLDAKVRNVEYKDPIQEEWEQFQREIKEESSKAQQIIAEDQEEATNERQIDEIDEQIRNWSRVVDMEKKKQEVVTVPCLEKVSIKDEASSGDEDFEEFGDWRSKKSFH